MTAKCLERRLNDNDWTTKTRDNLILATQHHCTLTAITYPKHTWENYREAKQILGKTHEHIDKHVRSRHFNIYHTKTRGPWYIREHLLAHPDQHNKYSVCTDKVTTPNVRPRAHSTRSTYSTTR